MGIPPYTETRAAIKFCVCLGYSAAKTVEELRKARTTPPMQKSAVYKWHKLFKSGRESIEDDTRSGRPSLITSTLVTSVRRFIEEDRRRSIQEISDHVGVSYGTVHSILHEKLGMKRLCARWVPRVLKEAEMQKRVELSKVFLRRVKREGDAFLDRVITCDETWLWLYEPETKQQSSQWTEKGSPPTKARSNKSGGKFMFIMFCDRKGMLLCHAVPPHSTVNSEYYSKVLRRDLHQAVKKKRPGTELSDYLLHQDNAPCHVSKVTSLEMLVLGLDTVVHPPYSPDLAPIDFAIFPEVKMQLRGYRFGDLPELRTAVNRIISNYDEAWYRNIYSRWVDRHRKCIATNGVYFEKL